MSRIGKQPVNIPNGVTIELQGDIFKAKGPKGELTRKIHPKIEVKIEDSKILVNRKEDTKESRSLHGLTRNTLLNLVEGVSKGFESKMEIIGVGYRASAAKNKITLTLGYSHPIEYIAPAGIEFKIDEENKNIIIITGIDKQTLGEVAAKVRSYRKPEPYKGKGIRYMDEYVMRKAGKSAAGAGATAK